MEKDLKTLLVDDKHGIIYCYIPKKLACLAVIKKKKPVICYLILPYFTTNTTVASTNWKRFMFILKQDEPYKDPMSIPGDLVHHYNQLTHLSSFPKPEQKVSSHQNHTYDFVGRQETLQDDAEQLLHNLQLENDIKFPPAKENKTTPDSVLDWYRTVPLEARRKLYKLYEADFKLFGYRKPNALLDE
ncbi:hypothetical protein LDENG_00258580 [Lucifuga dentata]|nr:hypothetical protein LDENG_00258580 [Lucifuga dentata]